MKVPLATLTVGLVAGFLLALLVRSNDRNQAGISGSASDGGGKLSSAARNSRSMDLSNASSLGELEALVKQSRDKVSQARLTLAMYQMNGEQIRGVMEELRVKIESGSPDQDTFYLQNQLLAVWMDLSPDDTFDWIDSMPSMSSRQGLYGTALSGLAESDANTAISLLSRIPDELSRSQIEQRLMRSMIRADPDVAFEFYKSNENLPENRRMNVLNNLAPYKIDAVIPELERMGSALEDSNWAVENIFQTWANQDFDAVKAYIDSTDSDLLKSAAIEAAAGKLAKTDPAAAIAMIQTFDGKTRASGMKAAYTSWMDHDPDAALASLSAITDKKLRSEVSQLLVENLNWRNPEGAVSVINQMEEGSNRENAMRQIKWAVRRLPLDDQEQLIRKIPEQDRGSFLAGLASELVVRNVERGTSIYLEMSEKDRSGSGGAEFLGSLSQVDPDRALALANELPNAAARNSAIGHIVNSMMSKSPEEAVGYLDKLQGNQYSEALGSLARSWGERDSDAAMTWAQGLSGEYRAQAVLEITARQSQHEPAKAADTFESTLVATPDGMNKELRSSANQIASNYAREDGPAAANWAASLGEESVARGAVAATIQEWSEEDLVAASEWTNALDDGPVRDAAVSPIVRRIQDDEPAAAIEWAASITDNGQRKSALRSTLKHWNSNDPDAARQGLDDAGLDQATYTEMLKVFE